MRIDHPKTVWNPGASGASTIASKQGERPQHLQIFTQAQALIAYYENNQYRLDSTLTECLTKNLEWDAGKSVLSFRAAGRILNWLKNNDRLSDTDKMVVWQLITNTDMMHKVMMSNLGAKPEILDRYLPSTSWKHAFQGPEDEYHWRLANMHKAAAYAQIVQKETNDSKRLQEGFGLFGANQGDIHASVALSDALRAFKDHGFAAFADNWIKGFLTAAAQQWLQK